MSSRSRHFFSLFMLLSAWLLGGSAPLQAQWLVYDIRFQTEQESSVNFGPYSGAYLIAPIEGGVASMIFVTEEGGRFYTVAANSARYFIATNTAKRRAVISAMSQNGTSQVMYQVSGDLNSTMAYTSGGQRRGARVSLDLTGTLLASDTEAEAQVPGPDGSIGMVGSALVKGSLRVDLSRILNQTEIAMRDALGVVVGLLEKYGYQAEEGSTVVAPLQVSAAPATMPAPQAPTPVEVVPDNSLFPPGTRDEMERLQR